MAASLHQLFRQPVADETATAQNKYVHVRVVKYWVLAVVFLLLARSNQLTDNRSSSHKFSDKTISIPKAQNKKSVFLKKFFLYAGTCAH
jgi:hypothetical protein